MDCCLFSWANIKFCLVGEGKWSDEVNERFGLCSDLINTRFLRNSEISFWARTVHGRSYWIDKKQSISCRTWIECRIAGLFGFFILLNFTYITEIANYFTYIVISLLSSWPKLSHLNSVSISSSEFVNHLCKQQWNEYSSSSDSDLFESISLISG